MIFHEFGAEHSKTILLLHGGGLSWWSFRAAAQLLQSDFHVVLPVLDGHAGSDRPFTSIEDNASKIISFIDTHFGGKVELLGGLSLGGQIVLEMLAQRADLCRHAIVESAAVFPSDVTRALLGPAVAGSYSLIKNKAFAKLQFHALHLRQDLFEEYYHDTCQIKKTDMVAFLKASAGYSLNEKVKETSAQVHVFAGEKETREILRSADAICQMIPHSKKQVLAGLYHGEFSINQPENYAQTVERILKS